MGGGKKSSQLGDNRRAKNVESQFDISVVRKSKLGGKQDRCIALTVPIHFLAFFSPLSGECAGKVENVGKNGSLKRETRKNEAEKASRDVRPLTGWSGRQEVVSPALQSLSFLLFLMISQAQ